ncbi:MAG: pirin family protein [Bdellovibrionota bacterium]
MIHLRKSNERGHAEHGWLKSFHTFSFADYYDPQFMGFRSLRVINEDWVDGGTGFGMHPHHNMEIVTYVISGALEHKDSLGNGGVLRPGEIQRMSAGKGIMHSETNPSPSETVHLLQIWLLPATQNVAPSYEQKQVPSAVHDGLALIASRDARDGTVLIQQDVDLYAAKLASTTTMKHELRPGRHAWIQVVSGPVVVNGTRLESGDAAAVSDETSLTLDAGEGSELLLFDLA